MTEAKPAEYDLRTQAIRLLIRAAQSTSSTNGIDFPGFLAQVLAATAANLGGRDRLLVGRPGSWEASYVDSLLRGTVGEAPDSWQADRTEPLVITLNVAELVESRDHHPGLLGLDDAIDTVGLRYESEGDDDEALDAWDAEIERLNNRYKTQYLAYAERFTTAAQATGKALALPVDVAVIADINPTSTWWSGSATASPTEFDADELPWAIWQIAHGSVALPNVDIQFVPPIDQPPGGRG